MNEDVESAILAERDALPIYGAADSGAALPRAEDSLRKRYAYKLGTNLAGLPITLVSQAIIPRMLGPADYGNFTFLTTFFTQVVAFFEGGTSSCFYSKLSHRTQDRGLLRFYWMLAAVISTLVLLFVFGVFGLHLQEALWPGQAARYIWMAAVWGLLSWYTAVINKVLDAYGLTVPGEIARFQQKVLGLGLILLMFWLRWFSLATFFLYQYVLFVILGVGWWLALRRFGRPILPQVRLTQPEVRQYGREFYAYSAPLFLFTFIGLLNNLQDRWFLQFFAGSVQQGFYGLSYQIGALCFLVSSAMTPLFWREMAKAFGEQDQTKMQAMFRRYVPLLYAIAAYLAVFIMLQAPKVSLLIGGIAFQQAALPISIMALYPLHQTYGQLTATFLLATGQTRLYRNVGVGMMVVDLLLTYWLVAPPSIFGLGLGATGLALKMVIIQFVGVNLQLWYSCRFLHMQFRYFLAHQFYSAALLAGVAGTSILAVDRLIASSIWSFIVSGAVYSAGCALLAWLLPPLIAMSRAELRAQLAWGVQTARRLIPPKR
jgi:O-antigen/teichoic acid export membrane protein